MKPEEKLRILVVDDEPDIAASIKMFLKANLAADVETVGDCASAMEKLSSSTLDLVFLDYRLPDGDGLSLLEEIVKMDGAPPVIMVTGRGDEQIAVSAFKLGASGYVVKNARLSTMLVEEARSALAKAELRKAEEALRASEERYRILARNMNDVIFTTDLDLNFTYVSPSVERQTGFTVDEAAGHNIADFITAESLNHVLEAFEYHLARQREPIAQPPIQILLEVEHYRKDGTTSPAEVSVGFLCDPDGTPYGALGVSRDITERKRAEEEIRALVEGLRAEKDFTEDQASHLEEMAQALYSIASGDFSVSLDTSPRQDELDTVAHGISMLAEEIRVLVDGLRAEKDFTEDIIRSIVDTLILVDPQAGIKTVNRETCELLGYTEDELVGSPVSMIIAEEEEEEEELSVFKGTRLTKLIEEGSIHNYDMTYLTKTGEEIPVSFSGSVMRDKDGELIGIVGIARDMREIKRLMQKEKELTAAERKRADELKQAEEEISRLSRRVMDEYEEARRKIAIDLHDDIGQSISALKIEVDMMRKEAGDRLEDQADRLEGMVALLEDTLDKIRSISGELRPVLLDDFGLEKALGIYVEEFSRKTGVRASLDCAGVPARLSKNIELSLFRIAQEALVNVARHADATEVRLSLLCEDGPLILTVDDNGNGFDAEKILHVDSASSHFGILGMRERASMVGGEFKAISKIGKGTTVVVKVPPRIKDLPKVL